MPTSVPLKFELTESAAEMLKKSLAGHPEATHVIIAVELDAQKYADTNGCYYHLQAGQNPNPSAYQFLESRGVKLAIAKQNAFFLDGATLDYYKLSDTIGGFNFRNPNAKPVNP